jgi:hypothetical protein
MTETLATAARHSKATTRWGTPADIVARARAALGGRIELDPMSEATFNEIVGAERYYTEQDNGLLQSWTCETMLLNPAAGLVVPAWVALSNAYRNRTVQRAVWIGFSVEHLNLLADEYHHPHDYSLLTCRKRISFTRSDGYRGSPSHGNYIVGLGIDTATFERAFAGMGRFDHGCWAVRP